MQFSDEKIKVKMSSIMDDEYQQIRSKQVTYQDQKEHQTFHVNKDNSYQDTNKHEMTNVSLKNASLTKA